MLQGYNQKSKTEYVYKMNLDDSSNLSQGEQYLFPPDEKYKAEYSAVWDSNSAFVIGFVSSLSFTLFFFSMKLGNWTSQFLNSLLFLQVKKNVMRFSNFCPLICINSDRVNGRIFYRKFTNFFLFLLEWRKKSHLLIRSC